MPTNFVRPAKRSASINPMTVGSSTSGYRTMCKRCHLSIFGEPAVWSRDPRALGLVHAEPCVMEAL